MSGFLRGWLKGEPLETACAYANACGAFAVSRLLCSPEYPDLRGAAAISSSTAAAARAAQGRGDQPYPLGDDAPAASPPAMALAIDHRAQMEAMADEAGAPRERIGPFKRLAVEAAARVAAGRPGFGMLIDGIYGREALFRAADHAFWIGRPVELPGSRPLRIRGLGGSRQRAGRMAGRPHDQMPVLLSSRRPAGAEGAAGARSCCASTTRPARSAANCWSRSSPASTAPLEDDTVAARGRAALCARHQAGLVEARAADQRRPPGENIGEAIEANDPSAAASCCSGSKRRRRNSKPPSRSPRGEPLVKGFAVGRTIFNDAARAWLPGRSSDEAAIDDMAVARFARL